MTTSLCHWPVAATDGSAQHRWLSLRIFRPVSMSRFMEMKISGCVLSAFAHINLLCRFIFRQLDWLIPWVPTKKSSYESELLTIKLPVVISVGTRAQEKDSEPRRWCTIIRFMYFCLKHPCTIQSCAMGL